jgi:hypothetical protein
VRIHARTFERKVGILMQDHGSLKLPFCYHETSLKLPGVFIHEDNRRPWRAEQESRENRQGPWAHI